MDIAERFDANPIVTPAMVRPSRAGLGVECVLNPGAFRFDGKTWLLMRVAERPEQREGLVRIAVIDQANQADDADEADGGAEGGIRLLEFDRSDPKFGPGGPCSFMYDGKYYLTTLSHLRLASSEDGVRFEVADAPTLVGEGPYERYGIEDPRVTQIGDEYLLTYTAASELGVAVGLVKTTDWKEFDRRGLILPPDNKDCAIFPEKVGGDYWCLHRPQPASGERAMWVARSSDLHCWGGHAVVARPRRAGGGRRGRRGMWDGVKLGAGAAPVRTAAGWLEIYHGVSEERGYCLGALLLDLDDPTRVVARSDEPIMEPTAEYERKGFVGNVVFTNGHVVDGDTLTIYYGASDSVICGARLSVKAILDSLGVG